MKILITLTLSFPHQLMTERFGQVNVECRTQGGRSLWATRPGSLAARVSTLPSTPEPLILFWGLRPFPCVVLCVSFSIS